MIADIFSNKKPNPVVNELFIRDRTINISLALITQPYFDGSKTIRLNSAHYFFIKTPSKRELQQIGITHSSDINF